MATRSLRARAAGRFGAALGASAIALALLPSAAAATAVDVNALIGTFNQGMNGDPGAGGTVTLPLDANAGTICFTLDVVLTDIVGDPVTSFDIRSGMDESLVQALGTATDASGHATGCANGVSPIVINAMLAHPGDYELRVDTAGFPTGAATAYLDHSYESGMLNVHTKVCPAAIQTLGQLTDQAKATCLDVVLPADAITPPAGFTVTGYGGTRVFDYHVVDGKHLDATIADAQLSGGGTCDPVAKVCEFAYLPYAWYAGLGSTTVTPTVVPTGTRFALAEAGAFGGGSIPVSMGASNAMTFDTTGSGGAFLDVYLFQAPDSTAPTVGTPTVNLRTGGTLGSTAPVRVAWTASDAGSGLDHYAVQVQIDGVTKTLSTKVTSKAFNTTVAPGHGYRYRVVAYDKAGNHRTSAWSPIVHVAVRQDTSSAISYSSGWVKQSLASASGGTVKYAKAAAASAKLTFYGRSIAWVAPKGLGKGSAKIYVDGKYVTTVSLYGTAADRLVDFSQRFGSLGTHTIKVVVVGTAGHPRIDVDAFLILN